MPSLPAEGVKPRDTQEDCGFRPLHELKGKLYAVATVSRRALPLAQHDHGAEQTVDDCYLIMGAWLRLERIMRTAFGRALG
jgi:hypothetical protein